MTNQEEKLLITTINTLLNTYTEIKLTFPYNDSYMEFIYNDERVGGVNPEGHNFLYNMKKVIESFEFMLK